MKFLYDRDHDSLRLNINGGFIDIYMTGKYMCINNEHDFQADCSYVFIKIGEDVFSLADIWAEAESQYEGIIEETAAENRSYARMALELSSPYQTGRV